MKAVCTILGWWTAGAAAAGICEFWPPIVVAESSVFASDLGVCSEVSGGEAEPPLPEPLAVVVDVAPDAPFASRSGLLLSECGAGGGELFVGVVISIGSPGEGADI